MNDVPTELKEALAELCTLIADSWRDDLNKLKGSRELTRANVRNVWFNYSMIHGLDMNLHDHGVICSLWFESSDFGTLQIGYLEDVTLRFVRLWRLPTEKAFALVQPRPARKPTKPRRDNDSGCKVMPVSEPRLPLSPVSVA